MKRNGLVALTATLIMLAILTGCSKSGTEAASNEKLDEFTIFVTVNPTQCNNYDDMYVFKSYEEKTGIHINWINTPKAASTEKVSLSLASGDLPDAYLKSGITNANLQLYGNSGDFIDLKPLLADHAPNFMAYANEHPDALASITTPDGKIYALPATTEHPSTRIMYKWFYNQDFLNKLGIGQPQTFDEFIDYLYAVKNTDLNGNGLADEVPVSCSVLEVFKTFGSFFGCNNRGSVHSYEWDADPVTGGVRHVKTSDAWREMLTLLNQLYKDGVIDQECITYNDTLGVALATQNRLGLYAKTNLSRFTAELTENWTPIEYAIPGPGGEAVWSPIRSYLHSEGAFVITSKCKDPGTLLEWVDYFYSDEGCRFYFYGDIGTTCVQNEDGTFSFTPDILAQMDAGKSYDEAIGSTTPLAGGNNPSRMAYPFFSGLELTEKAMLAADVLYEISPEVVWPILNYTPDELDVVISTGVDIDTYCQSMSTKFMTGEEPLTDANWNRYVATVQRMGLENYRAAVTAAIERAEAIMLAR